MPESETQRRPADTQETEHPPRTLLETCVRAATTAPSLHNSQPWLFRIADGTVDVFTDRRRRLEAIDPSGREMLISVGAAVFTLSLTLQELGWAPEVSLFPDAAQPDWAARITAGPSTRPNASVTELAAAIPRRHTNRLPFASTPVPASVLSELASAARTEGAGFHVAGTAARDAVLGIVRAADQRLRAQGVFRAELPGPTPQRVAVATALSPWRPGRGARWRSCPYGISG